MSNINQQNIIEILSRFEKLEFIFNYYEIQFESGSPEFPEERAIYTDIESGITLNGIYPIIRDSAHIIFNIFVLCPE